MEIIVDIVFLTVSNESFRQCNGMERTPSAGFADDSGSARIENGSDEIPIAQ
jgi:hypothetical protein